MARSHPNTDLLAKLDLSDLDASAPLFAAEFVWHFVNPKLPDVQGDYHGMAGRTGGTFDVQVVSATPVGSELVVVHVKDTMDLDGAAVTTDAVVVWRIVDGLLAEAWDIPAVYTAPDGSAATPA